MTREDMKTVLTSMLLAAMATGIATLMLSSGMGQPFWNVQAPLFWPFVCALMLSSLLVCGAAAVVLGKGRLRRAGFVGIVIAALLLLTLYAANVAYMWWRDYPISSANVFMPLWVLDYATPVMWLQQKLMVGVGVVVLGLPIASIVASHYKLSQQQGSHFQTHRELVKNGHFKSVGFPIGKENKFSKMILWADTVAMTILAVTELFKTSSLVLPALFTFPGSSISTDIKSELWKKSKAFFQSQGVNVYRWILFGDGSEENYTRINPFFYVPWETLKANSFLKMITRSLIPLQKAYEDTIWGHNQG